MEQPNTSAIHKAQYVKQWYNHNSIEAKSQRSEFLLNPEVTKSQDA